MKSLIDRINKVLFVILLTIVTLIYLKTNPKFKEIFYKYVYEKNFNFGYFNNLYKKYFGSSVLDNSKAKAVFSEKLEYDSKTKYKDGVELSVSHNYLVPTFNSGMVIYKGKIDNYGESIIIEQIDGVQVVYSNIKSELIMYDFIEKGSIIGEADKKLYLVFKKGDDILNYEDFI